MVCHFGFPVLRLCSILCIRRLVFPAYEGSSLKARCHIYGLGGNRCQYHHIAQRLFSCWIPYHDGTFVSITVCSSLFDADMISIPGNCYLS
jgi:hypothetical protein